MKNDNTFFAPAKNTIEKIFDAEKKASTEYAAAEKLAEERKAQIPQKRREIAEKYDALVKEKAEKEREKAQKTADIKVENAKSQTEKDIAGLKENFEKNLQNYIDEVYKDTIG
ncbi:MAG: hypothetical protein KBS41_00350 [Oscillospiraceae bacterium]|nr:hypothetical protein [Candidatus Equicaccousia limihippi]